jgi:hypothetical protein
VATGSDVANQIVRVRHLSEMSYKPFSVARVCGRETK